MRRRWRRSICGFATFSPWGEPKLRVGGCPQPAPVRAGGLREAARGLRLSPVRTGGLRESQWETVEPGRGSSGESRARGLGFAPGSSGPETSGGAGVRDWGAQPVGRRAIPERLLLACSV